MTSDSQSRRSTAWLKARRSGESGNDCVELRRDGDAVQIRDSKQPHGPLLAVPPAQFAAWLTAARGGEFPPAG
jgi:hypothetical protein